jgi:hypothetical protein
MKWDEEVYSDTDQMLRVILLATKLGYVSRDNGPGLARSCQRYARVYGVQSARNMLASYISCGRN